jgi:hypothetical protein
MRPSLPVDFDTLTLTEMRPSMRDSQRPIALKALELAQANIGVTEVGNNAGAAVQAYQQSCVPPLPVGSPWCAAVVRFRFKQAATDLGLKYDLSFPRTGWTPDYSRWAKANAKWIDANTAKTFANKDISALRQALKPGDLVLFYFSTLGRIGHIGVVEDVEDWGITTIEGNTSPEPDYADVVERDGDGYYRKVRHWSELGKFGGFVQIDF